MQNIVIEPDKWSFFQWFMTVLGGVITAVVSAFIFKKIKKLCGKNEKH